MISSLDSTMVFKSVKTKTIAAIVAIVAAVAVPQIFHLLGASLKVGPLLGQVFLPMHFAIFVVGLLAGPYVGLIVGIVSPAISFGLTGMPMVNMLPYMMIELAVYGLVAGFMANRKKPIIVKLLIAQISGRLVMALVYFIAATFFGQQVSAMQVLQSSRLGLFGLVLQWIIVPLLVFRIMAWDKQHEQ